ncbi:MAG: two-component sensor histidine kinase [Phycisphaerales bacterium]|nr:two-component sensor histidine kinase [Phycisphaerales bacterium]MCB9856173.1 two-component sensor histidine kinase [Phycisphaerales bacterium]
MPDHSKPTGGRSADEPAAFADNPADQLIEVAAIAGGLAHEVRNALSTLRVGLQLLDEDWRDLDAADDPSPTDVFDVARRGRKRIETLLKESGRLETILNDFLEFVRKRELRLSDIDLNELASDVAEFFEPQAQRHGIELKLQRSESSLPCRIDSSLLKQAVLNVLINAQQAMASGGTIQMTLSRDDEATARLDISDNGPGIEADTLARIFEAYYSTKRGGSGLGLAMTRRIVRAHGGTVRANSTPGEGTRFSFRFPLAGVEL